MPTTTLPTPVAAYLAAANAQDVDAVTACFDEAAVVHDEKHTRQGLAAIREWAATVSGQYHPVVEVLDVAQSDGRTVVAGRVAGNFPAVPSTWHTRSR